ncbi:MAG: CCA tRNA nucleotidyltransferase [Rickettsiaceae bacterium]
MHLNIRSKYYKQILSYLNQDGHEARIIGGCVRDAILEIPNADIDIATSLTPDQIQDVLKHNNIATIEVGKSFGTIIARICNEVFEITTLRKDIKSDGRYASVVFCKDFKVDSQRRDFTINALSYCPFKNQLYDYHKGLDDLRNHRVRFIGNANTRICEDYLRILRFFRFSCYYADQIDQEGLNVSIKFKSHLDIISKERVKQELDKMVTCNNNIDILSIMKDKSIFSQILPCIDINVAQLARANNCANSFNITLNKNIKYAVLLKSTDAPNVAYLKKYKFTKEEIRVIKQLFNLIRYIIEIKDIDLAMKIVWINYDIEYLIAIFACGYFSKSDVDRFFTNYHRRTKPKFPINGHDVKDYFQTVDIKNILWQLRFEWIKSDFQLSKDSLLSMAFSSWK